MSRKITTKNLNGINWDFYKGYDNDVAQNHPKDGSAGMIVFFVKKKDRIMIPQNLSHNYITIDEIPDVFIGLNKLINKYTTLNNGSASYSWHPRDGIRNRYSEAGNIGEKRIFKIEVGKISPKDAKSFVKKVQNSFKKGPTNKPIHIESSESFDRIFGDINPDL
jgi:hypothetical protein